MSTAVLNGDAPHVANATFAGRLLGAVSRREQKIHLNYFQKQSKTLTKINFGADSYF